MKLRKFNWIGIILGLLVIIVAIVIMIVSSASNLTLFLFGIGVAIMVFPFILDLIREDKRQMEISTRFLEFTRNLSESVSTGTPISKSIINMSRKNYGALSPYITKLSNQIKLGIPVNRALITFSKEVNNPVISRAVGLISEADRAGGEIDYILHSVSKSIAQVEKLRAERRAAIHGLIMQGYIIFFIFIVIMLVMEYKILPVATDVGSIGGLTSGGIDPTAAVSGSAPVEGDSSLSADSLAKLFLYLLLAQGLFTGLTIGKLAESSLKAGIKHSFIMMISAFLISLGTKLILGEPVSTL